MENEEELPAAGGAELERHRKARRELKAESIHLPPTPLETKNLGKVLRKSFSLGPNNFPPGLEEVISKAQRDQLISELRVGDNAIWLLRLLPADAALDVAASLNETTVTAAKYYGPEEAMKARRIGTWRLIASYYFDVLEAAIKRICKAAKK